MRRFDLATWENEAKKSPHFASHEAGFWGDFALRTRRSPHPPHRPKAPLLLTRGALTVAISAGTAALTPAHS